MVLIIRKKKCLVGQRFWRDRIIVATSSLQDLFYIRLYILHDIFPVERGAYGVLKWCAVNQRAPKIGDGGHLKYMPCLSLVVQQQIIPNGHFDSRERLITLSYRVRWYCCEKYRAD